MEELGGDEQASNIGYALWSQLLRLALAIAFTFKGLHMVALAIYVAFGRLFS